MNLANDQVLQITLSYQCRSYLRKLVNRNIYPNLKLHDDEWCHHITLYHPRADAKGSPAPYDVLVPGDDVVIHAYGRVTTPKVDALLSKIAIPRLGMTGKHQAGGQRLLHITLGCAAGVKSASVNEIIATTPVAAVSDIIDLDGVVEVAPIIHADPPQVRRTTARIRRKESAA